jgi:hypothetical protein
MFERADASRRSRERTAGEAKLTAQPDSQQKANMTDV